MSTMTLTDIRNLLETAQVGGNLSRVSLHVTRVRQAVASLNAMIASLASQPAEQPSGEGYDVARHNDWLERNAQPKPEQAVGDGVVARIEQAVAWPDIDLDEFNTLSEYQRGHHRARLNVRNEVRAIIDSRCAALDEDDELRAAVRSLLPIARKGFDGDTSDQISFGRAVARVEAALCAPRPAVATPAEEGLKLDPDTNECSPDPVVRKAFADGYDQGFVHGSGATPAEVTDGLSNVIEWHERERDTQRKLGHDSQADMHDCYASVIRTLTAQCQVRKDGEVTELRRALTALLVDHDLDHGPGACGCRPVPENAGHTCSACLARTALASPSAGAVVPEGWKLVPVEPTPEMRSAFQSDEPPLSFARTTVFIGDFGERYAEMLAAAPEVKP
ncbi:hypothetical protein HBF26_17060 [Luteibacter jiangsuensis]|uniref:DUF222 domain-containing protein n=1 Tax=Luteibacter jiangsuensis TaxID=637577 RepID=A0ABX0Q7S1_9GAMM|nr:hypothetical protein [Luteibacter jiangsuensis]NID06608.1 hypothetical protein [Luteibacter jiangsuensis]